MAYKLNRSPAARDEYGNDNLREIVFRPYRIVYRVNHTEHLGEIARIWHVARGVPQL